MKNVQEDLKSVVQEVVDLQHKANLVYGIKPDKPEPNPPASDDEIEELKAELKRRGLPLPPSYRQFLAVSNGIRAFIAELNLLSAKGVLQPVKEELEEDFPSLSRFVVANGNTSEFISLDPDTVDANGEMEAVWMMEDGGEFRYANFATLLTSLRDQLRKTVKLAKADRKR